MRENLTPQPEKFREDRVDAQPTDDPLTHSHSEPALSYQINRINQLLAISLMTVPDFRRAERHILDLTGSDSSRWVVCLDFTPGTGKPLRMQIRVPTMLCVQ